MKIYICYKCHGKIVRKELTVLKIDNKDYKPCYPLDATVLQYHRPCPVCGKIGQDCCGWIIKLIY